MTPDTENHSQQRELGILPHWSIRHVESAVTELRGKVAYPVSGDRLALAHLPREESASVAGTHKAAFRALLKPSDSI